MLLEHYFTIVLGEPIYKLVIPLKTESGVNLLCKITITPYQKDANNKITELLFEGVVIKEWQNEIYYAKLLPSIHLQKVFREKLIKKFKKRQNIIG